MKENTEYLELFRIVEDTKFQQGQENLIFFQIFDIFYQNIIIRELREIILYWHNKYNVIMVYRLRKKIKQENYTLKLLS